MLHIGTVQIDSHVLLAPIAGYTDRAFRLMAREAGHCGLAYTELLHPLGIENNSRQALDIIREDATDQPLGVQIYGNDPEWFVKAARWAVDHGAIIVDINMGCPVDKVTKTNGGSMLLCDPDRTTRMAEQVVNAVDVPVTAKLRLGWDFSQLTAPRLARQLEDAGVRLITIHGRTTSMRFKGSVHLEGIASVVAAVRHIPVIGNGDINSVDDAARMMQVTGCAGVMIARGSIKRPWLLRDIDHWQRTGGRERLPEPTLIEKIGLIRRHFERMLEFRGERETISLMRGRIASYAVTMGHFKPIKERIRLMASPADFFAALDDLASCVADPTWTAFPLHSVPWGDERDRVGAAGDDESDAKVADESAVVQHR